MLCRGVLGCFGAWKGIVQGVGVGLEKGINIKMENLQLQLYTFFYSVVSRGRQYLQSKQAVPADTGVNLSIRVF